MIFNVVIKGGEKGEIVSMERGNAINVEIEGAFNVKGDVVSLRVKRWGEREGVVNVERGVIQCQRGWVISEGGERERL